MVDIAPLRAVVRGPVLTPSDVGFADEVAAWVLNYSHTPDVAVGATSLADVVEAVKFATANGLAVRVQATGHGSETLITDGVLILTRRLDTLTIDPVARTATIGAGVTWGRVVAAAAEHGLAPVSGSSPTVGVVGLLLGGGLGPLVRSAGVASDRVREIEIVTADGELVRASAGSHPDLLWALRGGKGGFGVVTEVTVELLELSTLYGGSLSYDTPDIETALRAWIDYTATADPDVSTSAALVRVPDLPYIPEPIRGRSLLTIRFAYPGDAATGERLAAPLRAAAPAYLDQLAEIPAADIATIHNDPPGPTFSSVTGRMLKTIDQDFATALLALAGPWRPFPFVATELRHLGAKSERDVAGGSAVGGRSAKFTLGLVAAPVPELIEKVIPGASARVLAAVEPWIAPENTINFGSHFTTRAEYEANWSPETFARLQAIRARYDPVGVFPYGWR